MFDRYRLNQLNLHAASADSQAERIISELSINKGHTIADIGSGGGYFTIAFARLVGKSGHVYAVDTKSSILAYVDNLAEKEGLKNIISVLGGEDEVVLPKKAMDLIFIRNVFHHLKNPSGYMQRLRPFLKPDGKIVVIDHKPNGGGLYVRLFHHHTPESTVLQVMSDAGYQPVAKFEYLSQQNFQIFQLSRST